MGKFLGALVGAILVGVAAMYILGLIFTGTLKVVGWLLAVLIGVLVFYGLYKMLSKKAEHAVQEHREKHERREQKAAIQEDLRQMETDRPSGSD